MASNSPVGTKSRVLVILLATWGLVALLSQGSRVSSNQSRIVSLEGNNAALAEQVKDLRAANEKQDEQLSRANAKLVRVGEEPVEGPVGPVGATGPKGPQGEQGKRGQTGKAGATGATGGVGPTGAPGAIGATGPAGPQGEQGSPGPKGDAGPQGPPGVDAPVFTAVALDVAACVFIFTMSDGASLSTPLPPNLCRTES